MKMDAFSPQNGITCGVIYHPYWTCFSKFYYIFSILFFDMLILCRFPYFMIQNDGCVLNYSVHNGDKTNIVYVSSLVFGHLTSLRENIYNHGCNSREGHTSGICITTYFCSWWILMRKVWVVLFFFIRNGNVLLSRWCCVIIKNLGCRALDE